MKKTIVTIIGLFLLGCASTESEVEDSFTNISNEPPATHHDKAGAKEAVVAVALATTIGVITKDNFNCSKECEQTLKESLDNATKYK